MALWSKSAKAARHLSCRKMNNQIDKTNLEFVERKPVAELQCFVCGKKTGCNKCEYLTNCEARTFSKYCICEECSKQDEESYHNYKQSFAARIMKFSK